MVAQFLIVASVLVEGQDPAADRIAGGVVTAHDQQQQITEKFQEGHVAGRRGMRHHRYQVVAAGLVDPLVPQALEIHRALDEFLATLLKRSEEHTSEPQSLMRHSYAVFCLNKKTNK